MLLIPSPHRNKTPQTHKSSQRDKQSSENQYNMLEIKTTNAQPRFLHYLTNVFIRTEVNYYYRKMTEKVKKRKQNDGSEVRSDFWTQAQWHRTSSTTWQMQCEHCHCAFLAPPSAHCQMNIDLLDKTEKLFFNCMLFTDKNIARSILVAWSHRVPDLQFFFTSEIHSTLCKQPKGEEDEHFQ